MKMKKSHYKHMQHEIDAVLAKYPNIAEVYESGEFPRSDKVKDLQTRFNFDLLYGAGLNKFVSDTLYQYLTDDHIATALKHICPKVVRRY